jgi:hypothetical protein
VGRTIYPDRTKPTMLHSARNSRAANRRRAVAIVVAAVSRAVAIAAAGKRERMR